MCLPHYRLGFLVARDLDELREVGLRPFAVDELFAMDNPGLRDSGVDLHVCPSGVGMENNTLPTDLGLCNHLPISTPYRPRTRSFAKLPWFGPGA